MKIQYLAGGFANQVRQYVFVRGQQRRHPEETWFYDDSWFFGKHVAHNGYELEKVFGLKLPLLSHYLGKDRMDKLAGWKERGMGVPQIFLETGTPVVLVSCYEKSKAFFGGMEWESAQMQTPDIPYTNIYYYEYWVQDQWFMEFKEENRNELRFPALTEPENLKYSEKIHQEMSVGIHVRRGDFVTLGWALPPQCYYESSQKVLEKYPNACFFVFSDDLAWCKANADALGFNLASCTVYVEGNAKGKNYRDMQLMSMCDGIIRPAQSSFSQVAGWLSQRLKFEVKL